MKYLLLGRNRFTIDSQLFIYYLIEEILHQLLEHARL